jgi:ferritin-like metal-binding protein YciE
MAQAEEQLVRYLTEAHAMEQQALVLLELGAEISGDEETARIYRGHMLETREHERFVAERLAVYGETRAAWRDGELAAVGLGLDGLGQTDSPTPLRLATAAYAFENLEIATYRVIERLAARAGDRETVAVAQRILEQEEAAAELVAGTLDRCVELTLAEPAAGLAGDAPAT